MAYYMKMEGRYKLVGDNDIILDLFRCDARTDKIGYDLINHRIMGGKIADDMYDKESLVNLLNMYDYQLNPNFYDKDYPNYNCITRGDSIRMLDILSERFTGLVSQKLKSLPKLESDKVKLTYGNVDYNTGNIDKYILDCYITHTDEIIG